MKISPYLIFNGNAEEAANFYAEVMDGTLENLTRFNQFPPNPEWSVPAEYGNLIGHCCITSKEFPGGTMSIADTLPSDPRSTGNGGVMLTLSTQTEQQAEKLFGRLSAGAQKINCPMQEVFYAKRYGELVDKFGIWWAVMCE